MSYERGTVIRDIISSSNRSYKSEDEDEIVRENDRCGATLRHTLTHSLLFTLNTLLISYNLIIVLLFLKTYKITLLLLM